MSLTQEQIVEGLGNLTVTELIDLTKTLEDKWGVKASPIPVPGIVPGPEDLTMRDVGEQTEFTVTLADAGAKKIDVIKAIREIIPGYGLKEAKELVEAAPKVVKENVSKAEADEMRSKLEAAGARVEVK